MKFKILTTGIIIAASAIARAGGTEKVQEYNIEQSEKEATIHPTGLSILVAFLGLPHHPVIFTPSGLTIDVKPDSASLHTATEYCGDGDHECIQDLLALLQQVRWTTGRL